MRAIILALTGAAIVLTAASAQAVGLGPLRKEGVTDGPAKAFYLTLMNPYRTREPFIVYAVGAHDEIPATRVRLPMSEFRLPGGRQRRFVVIADDLAPGERYEFRVCAERAIREEGPVHARVCSRLVARRLPQRF